MIFDPPETDPRKLRELAERWRRAARPPTGGYRTLTQQQQIRQEHEMPNRAQRRAARRAGQQPEEQVPLPRIPVHERVAVSDVFDTLVDVAAPEYEQDRDEETMTKTVVGQIAHLTDDQLVVLSSTASAIVALAGAQMQVRLVRSLGEALIEKTES